jgi:Phosphotransferase enzyme family
MLGAVENEMSGVMVDVPADEVRAVFGDIDLSALEAEQIYEPIVGATVGVWRVHAGARTVVLKLLGLREAAHSNWRAGLDESDWMYWRREACAYESDMFAEMPDGLRAPHCLHLANRLDGSVALWLEDLHGPCGADWPIADYGTASRHFGRWQGSAVAEDRTRDDRWLSRNWLRTYLTQRNVDDEILADDRPWQRAELAERFDRADLVRMRAMRADRSIFLDALTAMPPVVCHLDLHPRNLFADPTGTTAVIDWAYVGLGHLGEDVGNLVPDSVLDFHIPADQIKHLDERITDAYTRGLTDVGADIDPRRVRLGMTATMAAKYAWIAPAMARAVIEERVALNGRPISDAINTWAPAVRYLLDRADEARNLIRK